MGWVGLWGCGFLTGVPPVDPVLCPDWWPDGSLRLEVHVLPDGFEVLGTDSRLGRVPDLERLEAMMVPILTETPERDVIVIVNTEHDEVTLRKVVGVMDAVGAEPRSVSGRREGPYGLSSVIITDEPPRDCP